MSMAPETWLYRHDELQIPRPYGVDVDADDWLWEGCGPNRVVGHNLRTAELRVIPLPDTRRWPVYQVNAWHDKLVLTLGEVPYYLVVDPQSGQFERKAIPCDRAIVWYTARTVNDKLLLYNRALSQVLILDAPEATPRVVQCPFDGQLAGGMSAGDGLVYSALSDPCRMIRFDPVAEVFVDETPAPYPEAALSGGLEHDGILYRPDSAGGRFLAFDMARGEWLDPITAPDHGTVYGFIGGSFQCAGKGYFCLSSWAHRSRMDPKTGKIIIPDGPLTIDGKTSRFLERMLIFDPAQQSFDYLVAPPQPDGMPLLCYSWSDGERFAVTGMVIPFAAPGEPADDHIGPWLILQNSEADEVPALPAYDTSWDRHQHTGKYRRSYSWRRSLFLPYEPHVPATVNMHGPGTQFPVGAEMELCRRAAATDARRYWSELAESLLAKVEGDAARVRTITQFVNRAVFYNPIQCPETGDPIAVLTSHDCRCGQGVNITLALLDAAGIRNRNVGLHHHVVGEAFYDGDWHIADALFFGADQPSRDGRVLSVDELKAAPYFADAYAQHCFAYDPELLTSQDGFQVLGYCFGIWGSEPYYSYYLGGEYDCPPTLPQWLPAARLGPDLVRLRWCESVKLGGGSVSYDVRVFNDRGCTDEVFAAQTDETGVDFEVPEANRMYFVEMRAQDAHRERNPETWYPAARGNFVLVPSEQYGWYGVL